MFLLKIVKVLMFLVVMLIILAPIGFIIERIYYKLKVKNIKPYGNLVNVNGKKMHIYSMGKGDKTIIILPGYGISLPSAEYGPLMRTFSEDYKVVLVEFFGTGFSDETKSKRISKNYVEEIRTALKSLNISPPYILMPHSISGIYAEYYASKYPEEIESMILLDTISSNYIIKTPEKFKIKYKLSEYLQNFGLQRLLIRLAPNDILYNCGLILRNKDGYIKKEIEDNEKFLNIGINNTTINQMEKLHKNIKEVKEMPFPRNIPTLKIISDDTIHKYSREDIVGSIEYQKSHLYRLGPNAKYTILNGGHLIYRNNSKEIKNKTDAFLNNIDNNYFFNTKKSS